MQCYLIRHTTPKVAIGVCYGQLDLDVTDSFSQEAQAVLAKFKGDHPAVCYSSPLQRCAKLAETLPFGRPQHDERLKELNFGAWEGQVWDDIPRHEIDHWWSDFAG